MWVPLEISGEPPKICQTGWKELAVNWQPRLMLNLPKKSIGWQKSVTAKTKTRTRSRGEEADDTADWLGSYQEPLLLKNRQIVMMQTG